MLTFQQRRDTILSQFAQAKADLETLNSDVDAEIEKNKSVISTLTSKNTELASLRFKREFPCLQAGDDSVSFRLSFGLQYIFLLFLPIYDQRTLQNRILSRGMVNDYATMEIRSAGRRMNIPSTD